MSGRFIAVVGPSGVGKDSVMDAMAQAEPRLRLARRVITRPAEAGGEAFDGVSLTKFAAMRDAGAFAMWWQAHGLHYGVPVAVNADLGNGHDVLANLSRGVLAQAQAKFARFSVLSLTADRTVLAARLRNRGREDATQIARRLDRTVTLPDGIPAMTLDNSGALEDTVAAALQALYPVRA